MDEKKILFRFRTRALKNLSCQPKVFKVAKFIILYALILKASQKIVENIL